MRRSTAEGGATLTRPRRNADECRTGLRVAARSLTPAAEQLVRSGAQAVDDLPTRDTSVTIIPRPPAALTAAANRPPATPPIGALTTAPANPAQQTSG